MLYRILKYWVRFGYKIFFRRVYIRGMDQVRADQPAIFTVNHPSAFLEPSLIATSAPFGVHFMTRGDLFNPRFLWFFNATNQVPVFRFRDGFSRMRDNKSSFAECHKRLRNGARLLIFCEGSMKWIKKLRRVQPGAAKLAFGTLEEEPDLPLVIYPVGVSYDDHTRFRSDVMIEFGPPMKLGEHFQKYVKKPREAIRELTDEIQIELQKCILHIESDDDMENGDLLWQVVKNERTAEKGRSKSPFPEVKKVLDRFNELKQTEEGMDLRENLGSYRRGLNRAGLTDSELCEMSQSGVLKLLPGLISLVFLPFSLLYYIPLALATLISHKSTSRIEFYVSVRAVVFVFLFTLFLSLTAIAFFWLPLVFWWFFILPLGMWCDFQLRPFRSLLWSRLRSIISRSDIMQLAESRARVLKFFKHQTSEQ